ncbi:MAG TPA: SLATT domain-containing protein [Longimicrobium sp.]
MHDIIERAKEYRELVATRALGHEKSAEWHRHWGEVLGVVATALSAIVGSAIFVAVANQLGLGGQGGISLPAGRWAWLGYFFFGLLLISAPVLTGIQTYLNHPEQAARHKASWAGYYRIQQRLDLFLLRHAELDCVAPERSEALNELEGISKEIETVAESSLTLTDRAYADARKALSARAPVEGARRLAS